MNNLRLLVGRDPIMFACSAHNGQKRKRLDGSDEPYIRHPVRVAKHAQDLGAPHEAVVAALLHDVLEDCEVDFSEIVLSFGCIATIVNDLTDKYTVDMCPGQNRKVRKKLEAERLGECRELSRGIKALDLLDNLTAIPHDAPFMRVFIQEAIYLMAQMSIQEPKEIWVRNAFEEVRHVIQLVQELAVGFGTDEKISKLRSSATSNIIAAVESCAP